MNFEDKITELEKIVEKLEKGQMSLDESLVLFERGISLAKDCNYMLKNARQRVEKIIEEGDGLRFEDFGISEDDSEKNNC